MPPNTPIRIIAAYSRDQYRKPMTGMFDLVNDLYKSKGYEIDMEKSVYVGDAAGRLAGVGRRKDHGDTDYKLALNVGLKFVTPEVCRSLSDRLFHISFQIQWSDAHVESRSTLCQSSSSLPLSDHAHYRKCLCSKVSLRANKQRGLLRSDPIDLLSTMISLCQDLRAEDFLPDHQSIRSLTGRNIS